MTWRCCGEPANSDDLWCPACTDRDDDFTGEDGYDDRNVVVVTGDADDDWVCLGCGAEEGDPCATDCECRDLDGVHDGDDDEDDDDDDDDDRDDDDDDDDRDEGSAAS